MRLKYQLYPGTSYLITYHTSPDTQANLDNESKQIILNQIQKVSVKTKTQVPFFAILDNHLHLLATPEADILPKEFIAEISGGSSFQINKHLNRQGKLWDKYHCWGIFHEKAYNNISAYILGNPIRHGLVKSFDELIQYPFCSFSEYATRLDRAAVEEDVLTILKIKTEETKEDFYNSLATYK